MRETIVEGLPNDARLGLLGVAKAAGLVDLLAGHAEVGDSRLNVPARNITWLPPARDLTARLSGVVFVGEPALGQRLDLKRISLRTVGGGHP